MNSVSFHQAGVYDENGYPQRGEVTIHEGIDLQDEQISSEEKTWCGCHADINKGKELLSDYLESASIHGIAQTKGPQFYSWRRPVWLLLIVAMALALGWTLYHQIFLLYTYPIKTVTKMTINGELPFPAVTICNLNQYVRERLADDPMIERVLFHESQYATISRHLGLPLHNMSDLDNLTDVSGEELRKIVLQAAPRLEEMVLQCSWDAKIYDCKDLFQPLNTGYGTCFSFNGPHIEPGNIAKASSVFSKLRVLINTQKNQSYFSKLIHAGIKVMVHQPDAMPFPQFEGWFVRPGVAASMAISRSDSKCLPHPYKAYSNGYCEDTKKKGYENRLKRYQIYSAENCISDCIYEKIDKTCGCRHYFSKGSYPFCSAKRLLTCYIPHLSIVNAKDAGHCGCRKECEAISYSADMSYADFASSFISDRAVKDGLTVFSDYLDANVIDLRVFFKTLNVMEVLQEPEMSTWTVIGALGGQLGLFLGASALSFVELIEILLLMFVTSMRKAAYTALGRSAKAPLTV